MAGVIAIGTARLPSTGRCPMNMAQSGLSRPEEQLHEAYHVGRDLPRPEFRFSVDSVYERYGHLPHAVALQPRPHDHFHLKHVTCRKEGRGKAGFPRGLTGSAVVWDYSSKH